MKKKHGLLFGFAVLLMAALFTLAACSNTTNGDPTPLDPDFGAEAVITQNIAGGGSDLETYLNAIYNVAGNYVINLTGSHSVDGEVSLDNGVKVSLRGEGTISLGSKDYLFAIVPGAELIIRGPTLQGKDSATTALVMVAGSLTLHTGTITGHKNTSGAGGGVRVEADGGATFTKTGGSITGNTASVNGDAVFIFVDGGTGDRYRDTDAGPGDNITIPGDESNTQGAAPWV